MSRPYLVALAGYYGFGNLGDELLAKASVDALLRSGVTREQMVMLSNDPDHSRQVFQIDAVSRWHLRELWHCLRRSKTLLLGGGGLFQDATSLKSCLYYWGLVRLSLLCGAVPWALGQSVGPLSGRLAKWFTQDAVRSCRLVHLRDRRSFDICRTWKTDDVFCGHDLVFSWGDALTVGQRKTQSEEICLVNLCPDVHKMSCQFAEALSEYLRNFKGKVIGTALSPADRFLMEKLSAEHHVRFDDLQTVVTPADVGKLWGKASCALGMRLHFGVLSALSGVPLVMVPYDPKVQSFADAFSVPLWNGGAIPEPSAPKIPDDVSSQAVKREIDALCEMALQGM